MRPLLLDTLTELGSGRRGNRGSGSNGGGSGGAGSGGGGSVGAGRNKVRAGGAGRGGADVGTGVYTRVWVRYEARLPSLYLRDR